MLIRIDASQPASLVEQIVDGIRNLVDNRSLRPGTRLPSIRRFAADHDVSKFTVVQAYDRLVACGYVQPRQGAGFFVSPPARFPPLPAGGVRLDRATSVLWLMRRQASDRYRHLPGGGWLPHRWMQDSGLDFAMRELSHRGGNLSLSGYGDPLGFAPLREWLSRRLAEHGTELGYPEINVKEAGYVFSAGARAIGIAKAAGIKMAFGTDLVGELRVHQSEGLLAFGQILSSAEVIRCATIVAAEVLRMEGKLGVIAPGAYADLLVVEGNPLDDLNVLTGQGRHLAAIMKDGEFVKNDLG